MNIAFHYIYRDGANYKNFNTIIFDNQMGVTIEALKELLKSKLISEEYFYTDEWRLPDLHFGSWDDEFDHDFHTFEGVEYTDEKPNLEMALTDFIEIIKRSDFS